MIRGFFALILILASTSANFAVADSGSDSRLSHALRDVLQILPSLSISAANETLGQTFHEILDHPETSAENTYSYYALSRALKANEILKSSGVDLQLSVLWTGTEMALQEIGSPQISRGRADFGVDYSLFLMATADSVLNAQDQYELTNFALGLFSVDLADDPRNSQFLEATATLVSYLDTQSKSPPKSDRDRLTAMRSARQAYQQSLAALKSTPISSAVAGTENPTLEYNRRVLRRNLSSSDVEIQAASIEKLMALSATEDDQRRIFERLGDSSFSICSAAYYALKNQSHFPNSLIPLDISFIKSDSVPRSCRYAAVLLSLKFDNAAISAELEEIYTAVTLMNMMGFLPGNQKPYTVPMELNFVIGEILSGKNADVIPDLNSLCNADTCVGEFGLVHGFFKDHYGPISRVDDSGRIQLADSNKWIERKRYSKSVQSLSGLSVGDLAVNKKASKEKQSIAHIVGAAHAGNGGSFQEDWALEKVRGKIELIFENGFVLLMDTDIDMKNWNAKIENLGKL